MGKKLKMILWIAGAVALIVLLLLLICVYLCGENGADPEQQDGLEDLIRGKILGYEDRCLWEGGSSCFFTGAELLDISLEGSQCLIGDLELQAKGDYKCYCYGECGCVSGGDECGCEQPGWVCLKEGAYDMTRTIE